MHEYSITCSILEILNKVVKDNKLKKVKKVNFVLGQFGSIEPESIKFYFSYLTRGNEILKSAKLNFKKLKAEAKCNDCGKFFNLDKFILRCPYCSSKNVETINAEDIKIVSVEG